MMEDILPRGKLKVSSNDAMSNSLTDKSTETFWESRDEPRAKSKLITVTFDRALPIFGVAVHVDNQKDGGVRARISLWLVLIMFFPEVAAAYLLSVGWVGMVGILCTEISQLLCYSHSCGLKRASV